MERSAINHTSHALTKAQGPQGMNGQKDVKSQRSERSRVQQYLLGGTASGSHGHAAAVGVCTRPAQDEAR